MCCGSRKNFLIKIWEVGNLFSISRSSIVPTKFEKNKRPLLSLKTRPVRYLLLTVFQRSNLWFTEAESLKLSEFNLYIVFSISDFYHSWTWRVFFCVSIPLRFITLQKFSPGNTSRKSNRFCREHGASCGALSVLSQRAPRSPTAEGRWSSWSHRRYSLPANLID